MIVLLAPAPWIVIRVASFGTLSVPSCELSGYVPAGIATMSSVVLFAAAALIALRTVQTAGQPAAPAMSSVRLTVNVAALAVPGARSASARAARVVFVGRLNIPLGDPSPVHT